VQTRTAWWWHLYTQSLTKTDVDEKQ
jgi:hypothetical protein